MTKKIFSNVREVLEVAKYPNYGHYQVHADKLIRDLPVKMTDGDIDAAQALLCLAGHARTLISHLLNRVIELEKQVFEPDPVAVLLAKKPDPKSLPMSVKNIVTDLKMVRDQNGKTPIPVTEGESSYKV